MPLYIMLELTKGGKIAAYSSTDPKVGWSFSGIQQNTTSQVLRALGNQYNKKETK